MIVSATTTLLSGEFGMGLVKQYLLEQAEKDRMSEKLEQMSDYYGMSVEDIEMSCQNAAAQKGIELAAQIEEDFNGIEQWNSIPD